MWSLPKHYCHYQKCAVTPETLNQIKSLLLSHHLGEWNSWEHAPDSAETIYIWTVHITDLYRRQCAKKHIHILSTHSVLLDILTVINTHYTPYVHIYIMYIYTHNNMRNRLYIVRYAMSWMCKWVSWMVSSDSRCVSAVCVCSPVELC